MKQTDGLGRVLATLISPGLTPFLAVGLLMAVAILIAVLRVLRAPGQHAGAGEGAALTVSEATLRNATEDTGVMYVFDADADTYGRHALRIDDSLPLISLGYVA